MSGINVPVEERGLSVEMKRREHVKSVMISEDGREKVLFEGNLGSLSELSIVDCKVLEIKGINGVLRVDISIEELEDLVSRIRSKSSSGSKLGSVKNTDTEMK